MTFRFANAGLIALLMVVLFSSGCGMIASRDARGMDDLPLTNTRILEQAVLEALENTEMSEGANERIRGQSRPGDRRGEDLGRLPARRGSPLRIAQAGARRERRRVFVAKSGQNDGRPGKCCVTARRRVACVSDGIFGAFGLRNHVFD